MFLIHTHTHSFNGYLPDEPGSASYRLIFFLHLCHKRLLDFTSVFTGPIPLPSLNQQNQSTDEKSLIQMQDKFIMRRLVQAKTGIRGAKGDCYCE